MRKISDEIKDQILSMYPDEYSAVIAEKLNIRVSTVYYVAFMNKLKKSEEFKKKELTRQAEKLKIVGYATRMKPGQVAHNKGKPMPDYVYEKVKCTFFKKGNKTYNEKFDGYERLDKDGYIMTRIRKGKFVLKHRLLWKQHHGDIPKGMVVVFKNKDKYDIRIENLELITMQENMERNRLTKYPVELQKAIKLKNQLKNKINEKQNR